MGTAFPTFELATHLKQLCSVMKIQAKVLVFLGVIMMSTSLPDPRPLGPVPGPGGDCAANAVCYDQRACLNACTQIWMARIQTSSIPNWQKCRKKCKEDKVANLIKKFLDFYEDFDCQPVPM